MIKPICPCLWFDGTAKEAAEFYCSVFGNSKIIDENPSVVTFSLSGEKFMCLNGGAKFKFTPSISLYSILDSEDEVQRIWNLLIEDGEAMMEIGSYPWSKKYGWVKDKFGLTWQLTVEQPVESSQKFIPALMFTDQNFGKAESAMEQYMKIFPNTSLPLVVRYPESDEAQVGRIMHAQFQINGQRFIAMDSNISHGFDFNEAISFVVECDTQNEIDFYWSSLSEGGNEGHCGWLKDRYGVSWQIVPSILSKLMADPVKSQRVVQAFMKMKKFHIEGLMNV